MYNVFVMWRALLLHRLGQNRFLGGGGGCFACPLYHPVDSQDLRNLVIGFRAVQCTVFRLLACKHLSEFPAESGCKVNDLTRYKVDTVLLYIY